ncbi:uncharacterized protein LOC132035076 [Lycium ferocissimum]|uniref:uncharacterized protein LOC132035076 n=1 Tax=Lycium ferocissimum TaxID=112874 RepID=UPI0028169C6F|nr:uncharacterized protein LOC132035076 [Lycium ferocissimum]
MRKTLAEKAKADSEVEEGSSLKIRTEGDFNIIMDPSEKLGECWNIIKKDIMTFVSDFFNGKGLTKFYIDTCLGLIPKVDSPSTFKDFRTINHRSCTNKIILMLLGRRLNPILNKLISQNQSRFVTGRLIIENIMLAQEIIHDISMPNQGINLVIKLDMAKAYERLSWSFLFNVLHKLGFSSEWIDIIRRIISSVW